MTPTTLRRLALWGLYVVLLALAGVVGGPYIQAMPWWRDALYSVITGLGGGVLALALGILRWNDEVTR